MGACDAGEQDAMRWVTTTAVRSPRRSRLGPGSGRASARHPDAQLRARCRLSTGHHRSGGPHHDQKSMPACTHAVSHHMYNASRAVASPRGGSIMTPIRRPGRLLAAAGAGALVVGVMVASPASAANPPGIVSLAGSNFEIDTDANLKVDDPGRSTGPASPRSGRRTARAGRATTRSATAPRRTPPSHRRRRQHPAEQERPEVLRRLPGGTSGDRLPQHVLARVQDPTGTTNMDFEFNQ